MVDLNDLALLPVPLSKTTLKRARNTRPDPRVLGNPDADPNSDSDSDSGGARIDDKDSISILYSLR